MKGRRLRLQLLKTDSETKKPLEGAVFGLFAKEDIVNSEGTVLLRQLMKESKAVTGADGTVTFVRTFHLDSIM